MLTLSIISFTGFVALFASVSLFAKTNADQNPKYILSDLGIISRAGSEATAINDEGKVIGFLGMGDSDEFDPRANHTFLCHENKVTDFGRSRAGVGINNKGQIVGFEYLPDYDLSDSSKMFAFSPILYIGGKWKSLLPKGSDSGYPAAINDGGQVAGLLHLTGSPSNTLSPAVWSGKEVHFLEIPAAYISGRVTGINDAGQVVGFLQKVSSTPASYETYAVLWDNGNTTRLGSLPDSGQSQAVAINQRGLILCLATYNWGKFQKYMQEMLE
jgi:probable HAF family extracellular repeat protein